MPKRNRNEEDPEIQELNQRAESSNSRRVAAEELFIAYDMEELVNKQLRKKERKLMKKSIISDAESKSANDINEHDAVFVQGLEVSVATHIKQNAVKKHSVYQQLDPNKQAIVCLGLNSIIDLSASYPERQSTLFSKQQWRDLQHLYPKKAFNTSIYDRFDSVLAPFFALYNDKSSITKNWNLMFKKILELEFAYNPELNEAHRDVAFLIHFLKTIMLSVKNHAYLFNKDVNVSEWDYIVKFWAIAMEFLFTGTGLRLKWGDTTLSIKDIETVGNFKVDMRVINDKVIQRLNNEGDTTVAEAAKSNPGVHKYNSDRCKVMSESKVIIDNFLHDSYDIGTTYSIQFCGLEMSILSTSLAARGFYAGNEVHHAKINNNLGSLVKHYITAKQLLCYRDDAVRVSKARDEIVSNKQNSSRLVKDTWRRGTWVPPRRSDAPVPPIPSRLTHN